MINPIINLPILTKDNVNIYKDWHKYYETVYKKPVTHDVDLNTFNWFYWYSPLGNIKVFQIHSPIGAIYTKEEIVNEMPGENIPFIFNYKITQNNHTKWNRQNKNFLLNAPEVQLKYAGFFIRKKVKITNYFIEVFRTNLSFFTEKGACWFFHVKGSGIFLKTGNTFIGIRKDLRKWNDRNPYKSLEKIDTFIIKDDKPFSIVYLNEIVYKLNNKNINANTADLPLYKGDINLLIKYRHRYDYRHCMI